MLIDRNPFYKIFSFSLLSISVDDGYSSNTTFKYQQKFIVHCGPVATSTTGAEDHLLRYHVDAYYFSNIFTGRYSIKLNSSFVLLNFNILSTTLCSSDCRGFVQIHGMIRARSNVEVFLASMPNVLVDCTCAAKIFNFFYHHEKVIQFHLYV